MTISETADRIWAALVEMKESEGVVLKDHFTRRVTEILAAEEATVEEEDAATVKEIVDYIVKYGCDPRQPG